jgi:hypothetical protein
MKKAGIRLSLIALSTIILFSIFSTTLVLAQDDAPATGGETNFEAAGRNIATAITNLFSDAKLDPNNFTLILFGILVWMIVYTISKQVGFFKDQAPIWSGAFALVVTILAFKGFPPEYIETILMNYQAMGGTIVVLIPTIIIMWFTIATEDTSLLISRLIWIVYLLFFVSLFVFKIGNSTESIFAAENLIYSIAIVIGIVILITLGILREFYWKNKVKSLEEKAERKIEGAAAGLEVGNKILQEIANE